MHCNNFGVFGLQSSLREKDRQAVKKKTFSLQAKNMNIFLGYIIFFAANLAYLIADNSQVPHIVIIYLDDMGWNDVSFHGSPEIPTPSIDALALNGIVLQNYYGEWPSRAALLTGKYPMRLGLQHFGIKAGEASGLPLNETIMPQYFKKFGYKTYLIGKWHLGYQTKEYTPTYRGFDTFYGFWNDYIDNFDYTHLENDPSYPQPFWGLDLHDGLTPVNKDQGRHAPHMFTDQVEDFILNHITTEPMFMLLAQLAPHTANAYQRQQVPGDDVTPFKYIKDLHRRIHAGIVRDLDRSVEGVFRTLQQRGMLENTIFIFMSDNGAQINPAVGGYGTNYPLRGNKDTYWEGAIRVPAVIWSPLLNLDKPRISQQLMHVSDWLPTLYSLIGGDLDDLGLIDGFDMWKALVNDTPSPRTSMLQNLDPISGTSAFRLGDLKYVNGSSDSDFNSWTSRSGLEYFNGPTTYDWVFRTGTEVRDIMQQIGMWIVDDPDEVYQKLRVTCEQPPPKHAFSCNPAEKPCLFNITADPCEYHDRSDQYPDVMNEISERILQYKSEEVWPQTKPADPSANPLCYDFLYVPWLDSDEHRVCDFWSEDNTQTTN